MLDTRTVNWESLFHQQNLQIYGIFAPDLDTYCDADGTKMFREFRLQFSNPTSDFDPVSMKLPARPATETPYSFQEGLLLYNNEEINLSNINIFRIPIPPEESSWHLKGYTFPYRGSKNPYRELRINLKISGYCPGHCFFCHRTHSHRVKVPQKFSPDPGYLLEQVKISEGADIFRRITRIMFISELYGNEAGFLEAIKKTSNTLLSEGYPEHCEFNCCATDVRSMEGLIQLHELVRPNYFSFSLEFFHNREQWMGRYKGISITQVYRILENARKAGFDKIQLNYLAGIDTLKESEQGFSTLARNGLVDSVGLSTFTIFAEDEYEYRLAEAWNTTYYQQLAGILSLYKIKANHPDSYDMGCPYTALMET